MAELAQSTIIFEPRQLYKTASVLGRSDVGILLALHRYHYLTAAQLCRLFLSTGSLTYAQTKLKHLADLQYVQRVFIPRLGRYGSSPCVYRLAQKGINLLKGEGFTTGARYRRSEGLRSYLTLHHTVSLNSVLIQFELASRSRPELRLHDMVHERDLKRRPFVVRDADGRGLTVIPDAVLDMRLGSEQMCLVLEHDMNTEDQRVWRRKIRGLVAYSRGAHQERFGTESLTVLGVTTGGEHRLDLLIEWTERELGELGIRDGDMFRLAAVDAEQVSADELLLAPIWIRPLDRQVLPLIDRPN